MAGEPKQEQDDDLEMRRERGDFVDDDDSPDDGKKAAAEDDAPKDEGDDSDDGKKDDEDRKPPPYSRFKAVTVERDEERTARLRLEGEVAALRRQLESGGKPPPAPEPPVDIKALRKQARDAMLEGDTEKAAELDNQADEEMQRRADERAAQRIAHELAMSDLRRTAEQIAAEYPFLDSNSPDADPDAIDLVVAQRDVNIRNGMSMAEALAKAAKKVGKMFAPAAKDDKGGDDPAGERTKQAILRSAKAANAQPAAPAGGRGDRSRVQSGEPLDVSKLSEEEFAKLPEKERAIARGDFV